MYSYLQTTGISLC